MTSILAFSGSSRTGSFNQRTLTQLLNRVSGHGAHGDLIDIGALNIPLYNADIEIEQGLPASVIRFRDALTKADGLIIACPEYNGFITPLLINAIDWATRSPDRRPDLAPFNNKPVLICSASPGGFGGLRAAAHLRTLLSGIGCLVLPHGITVPSAMSAFSEDGTFADDSLRGRADAMVARLIDVTQKLK